MEVNENVSEEYWYIFFLVIGFLHPGRGVITESTQDSFLFKIN